jgi:hypothetical protein
MMTSARSGTISHATSRTVRSPSSSTTRRAMRSTSSSDRWPLPFDAAGAAETAGCGSRLGCAAAAAGNAGSGSGEPAS